MFHTPPVKQISLYLEHRNILLSRFGTVLYNTKSVFQFRIFKFRLLVSKISMCQFRFSVFLVRFRISISEIEFLTSVSNLVFSFFQFPTSCSQCPSCDFQLLYLSSKFIFQKPTCRLPGFEFPIFKLLFYICKFRFLKKRFPFQTFHSSFVRLS